MSEADHAQDIELRQRELDIELARSRVTHLEGPVRCVQCGALNDRRHQGYAACTDCVEGVV